jgi:hypothetical protein
MKATSYVAICLLMVSPAPLLQAQPPRPISFQGVLTDTLGKAKPDGQYDFRFNLYDGPTGGMMMWSEQRNLPVLHGLFNVMLGDVTPLAVLDFANPYWLGIQVGGAPEMMPRMQLSASGFSYHARNALRSDVADSLTAGRIAPGSLVRSVNSITDNVKLVAGSNISISQGHDTLRISATGAAGIALPFSDSLATGGSAFRVSNTSTGMGLWGVSKNGSGVLGNSEGGNGVTGFSATKNGVYGHTSAGTGFGMSGRNEYLDSWGFFGGYAPNGTDVVGVYGSGSMTGGAYSYGVYGEGKVGVQGVGNIGVYGSSDPRNGYGVIAESYGGTALSCIGSFEQNGGKFTASPTSTTWTTNKPATVKTANGTPVKLFSEEAAELYFNDYGDGRLTGGIAHIELDPLFLETVTVNAAHPLKAFVQLEDDSKGVYVTRKTTTGFDVVELQGGTSNARFTYRVMCKRKYYEDERLATEEQDITYNLRVLQTVWPEILAGQNSLRARSNRMMSIPERQIGQ